MQPCVEIKYLMPSRGRGMFDDTAWSANDFALWPEKLDQFTFTFKVDQFTFTFTCRVDQFTIVFWQGNYVIISLAHLKWTFSPLPSSCWTKKVLSLRCLGFLFDSQRRRESGPCVGKTKSQQHFVWIQLAKKENWDCKLKANGHDTCSHVNTKHMVFWKKRRNLWWCDG